MNLKTTSGSDIERQSGKLKYLLTVLLLTFTFMVQAQGWEFSFGGDKEDQGTAILQTVDRGILEIGFSESFGLDNDIDIYVVRTDVDGTLIWERTYDEGFVEQAFEVIPVGQDGFLIVGYLQPAENMPAHAYLLRIDNRGDLVWSRQYDNDGFDQRTQDIKATADGGYILAGTTQTSDPDNSDVLLIKVDADGQEQWRNKYDTNGRSERGVGVVETPTGYMLAADVKSAVDFKNDIGLYLIDVNGNQQDTTRIYGAPDKNEEVKDLIYTSDDKVVFVGSTQNLQMGLVARADLNGDTLWTREIMAGNFDNVLNGVIEEQNGKLTAVGQTLPTAVNVDVLFVQLDTSGIVELQRNIGDDDVLNTGEDIALTYDGGYVIAGYNAKSAVFFNDLTIFKINGTARHLTNEISGKVFVNDDEDCGPLQLESRGLSNWQVRAEKPGRVFYGSTDADGNYKMLVDTGIYNLSLVLRNDHWMICDEAGFSVNFMDLYDTEDFDFSVVPNVELYEPLLEVSVSAPVLNICEEAEYTVHYCNLGPKSALNSQVDVVLDQELSFVSSSIETDSISVQDSLLSFRLGTVGSQDCGSFTIRTQVACDDILPTQAISVSATITPNTLQEYLENNPSIRVSARCVDNGGSNEIRFQIENIGGITASEPVGYIVVEDQIIHLSGQTDPIAPAANMPLPPIPADEGSTYRLMTEQVSGHPGRSMPSIAIEGCTDQTVYSTGFFTEFPENDNDPFIDIDVQEVIESGVPVVLKGHPKGYQDSIITATTDLEYHLVFENTGNDIIDRIVIRDTLPNQLDLSTLEMGPSSHPYEYELYDGGILKITFADIQLLPDGGDGEAISQGFVKFRLSQKPNNPLGTVIRNRAAVFFDYQVPQSTNVEERVVGCIDFLNLEESCLVVDIDTPEPFPGFEIKVFPNPFNETATFELIGCTHCQELELELFDVLGRQVRLDRSNTTTFQFERKDLPAGAYWFSLRSSGQLLSSGKMIITQ